MTAYFTTAPSATQRFKSCIPSSLTGIANPSYQAQLLAVQTIPPGLLLPNTHIEITAQFIGSNSPNTKTIQASISQGYQTEGAIGSGVQDGQIINSAAGSLIGATIMKGHVWVGTNSEIFVVSEVNTAQGEGNAGIFLPDQYFNQQLNLNAAFGIDVVFAATLSNASDYITLNAYDIEVKLI